MGLEETDRYQSPVESCGRITASLRKDCDLIAPKPQPRLRTSEVGRFLRKRQCKGSQIAAKTDRRRNGPPQKRTARRSFPTSEVIGLHSRVLPQTQPRPGTSEVGRFLRKRQCKGSRTAAETDHRKDGPLGDRSLPQKLIRLNPGVLPKTQPQSSGRPDGS
jgi:hypothetical protein